MVRSTLLIHWEVCVLVLCLSNMEDGILALQASIFRKHRSRGTSACTMRAGCAAVLRKNASKGNGWLTHRIVASYAVCAQECNGTCTETLRPYDTLEMNDRQANDF